MRRSLLDKYARPLTVSNEGFGDLIRSLIGIRKDEAKSPTPAQRTTVFSWLDWVATNLPNGQLSSKLKTVAGPVEIPAAQSGYFHRDGRQLREGMDEYDADINVLSVIYKKLKPVADKYAAAAAKQLDQIAKLPMEVTPENAVKVNALLESFIGKLPQTPADAFESRWMNGDPWGWIGGKHLSLVTTDSEKRAVFQAEYLPVQSVNLSVSFADASDVAHAIKMLNHLIKWADDLYDLKDTWPFGDDPTDPPLRGFSQDITAKAWQGYDPLYVDNLSCQLYDMARAFGNHVDRLITGLVYYLIAATEPT